jgi:ribose-phosphate pyrophosphokinase
MMCRRITTGTIVVAAVAMLATFTSVAASAQGIAPVSAEAALTLQAAEARLFAGNRDIAVARRAVEQARADTTIAGQKPNPQLGVAIQNINRNRGIGAGSLRDKTVDTIVGISQTIERGGKAELRVAATAPTDASVLVTTAAPTPAPTDETCAGAPPIEANASIDVDLGAHVDDIPVACASGLVDAARTLTLARASDVLLLEQLSAGDTGAVSLAAKRASAERVTAVIPYFGYARQDRKDEGRTPITAKLVANLLERAGADRVVSVDMHAAQVQGFFDIPVDHLNAGPVVQEWIEKLKLSNIVFVSPDVGNVKRAQKYANMLGGEICIIDKRRRSGSTTEAKHIIGDVEGKNVLMVDDMITTAGTVTEACKILRDHGVKEIYMTATHAVFAPPAMERLARCPFTKLAVTDTIPIEGRADAIADRLEVLSVAPLLGDAIDRIHRNQSVSALFDHNGRGKRKSGN